MAKAQAGVLIRRWLDDERGATSVEYSMIAAGVALAIVATLGVIKTDISTTYGNVNGAF